ncbi:MAG: N-acetyltransferase [Clostridium perfringens]|nr:N-acetyltransferase [Clostridium perfringens]
MIEELSEKDIDELMELWLKTTIEAHNFISEDYWINNYNVVKNEYIPIAKTFVYKKNNVVQGFISIIDDFYIGALFVLKEDQNKGIGKKLIDYCRNKYKKLELAVYAENKNAIEFYKKCGFKIIREQNNEESNHYEYMMRLEK